MVVGVEQLSRDDELVAKPDQPEQHAGKPAEAVRFGPGPACSGIRKAVSFELTPGRYMLEISGGTVAESEVLVERLP